ncbi:RNA polymerase sigma factor SigX [Oceanobacillus sp. FSL H7-0719]|uniref:RNA polymerase sigma factor SigX n=1 Tax=Oceanobacillus sp. FSL H7-0719 TaxID=2954507 RepID=UPI00325430DF
MKSLFDSFYNKYHQDLYNYVIYMVKNKQLAEDLIQEIYIRVIKSYENFRGDSSEKTWLFSIARHVTYDFFRSQKRKRKYTIETFNWEEQGENILADEALPEELMIQNERMQLIYECLDQCTLDQKNIIILRFIQEFTLQETADILGMTVSKVKTTQHRGIKTLRKLLERENKKGADL